MEKALKIRNVLLWAFLFNYILIFITWLVSMTGFYHFMMGQFFEFTPKEAYLYLAYLVGFWKIMAVMLLLIPAIAIHIEFKVRGKK